MISCILLSAGYSQRFGSPKALAEISDGTVIARHQKVLLQSNVFETIIVLGAHADLIKPAILKHKKLSIVYNNHYNFGQTSSFKVGLEKVSKKTQGVMLLPVDYPFICTDTLNHLIQYFMTQDSSIFIPSYCNRKGHPPIFDISFKEEIMKLSDSQGVNSVIHNNQDKINYLPVDDEGVVSSFNTQEELITLKKKFL